MGWPQPPWPTPKSALDFFYVYNFFQAQFTWYDFDACDVLAKSLQHELFNENQTKNILSCD